MNIPHPSPYKQGNVLLVTLSVIAVIGIALVVSLSLAQKQNYYIVRSQAWNACIPVIEAGIEEAMAHLNNNKETNLTANGWALSNGLYTKSRQLGESYYSVSIQLTNILEPTIVCTGYVRLPALVDHTALGIIAQISLPPNLKQEYVSRAVRVLAKKTPRYVKAMVAKERIDMNGNKISTDSFDSSDPNFSTPDGRYDPTKIKDNGDVATVSGLTDSIGIGNANIKGHVRTGPGGTATVGSNGKVGSLWWHATASKGIQPGWISHDMNMSFPDVEQPFKNMPAPLGGSVNNVSYTYVLGSAKYEMANLNLSSSQKMAVTGNAELLINGSASLSGAIDIFPPATLKLYVAGPNTAMSSDGINSMGRAASFQYWGLPNNKSIMMTGNGQFTGVIYAPNADMKLAGGGSGVQDFVGACIVKNVSVGGHYNFHFDEALGSSGPPAIYVIVSWLEI
jgi:hypothetical protein